jgi:hypothetical protein
MIVGMRDFSLEYNRLLQAVSRLTGEEFTPINAGEVAGDCTGDTIAEAAVKALSNRLKLEQYLLMQGRL